MTTNAIYKLEIRTPEGIAFGLQLGGPVIRFLAWIIDFFCVITFMMAVNAALGWLSFVSYDLASAVSVYLYFVLSVGYAMALEWAWRGQTIGKRLFHLRVMDADGLKLRFGQVVVRNLMRVVDDLPVFYAVGGTVCLFSRRAQRLGDLAAGTVVVHSPRLREPALDRIKADKFNSFQSYPYLAARLRQTVSPAEAALLVEVLQHRETLDLGARLELYRDLADHLREKVTFPQEVTDGLSDENYLLDAVRSIYQIK